MTRPVAYLTPGCFDKGGISRYSRYQIRALREILGPERVATFSVLGPDARSFEEPFAVDYAAGGTTPLRKLAYVSQVVGRCFRARPAVIYAAHVNLGGLARALASATGARCALNVYGLEVWSGLRADARYGLAGADLVVSDCHHTAEYLRTAALRPTAPVDVLWDCVDTERFTPGAPRGAVLGRYGIPFGAGVLNVLTLGRLAPAASHKGYDRLLEAFGRVARPCPGMHLVFAGGGSLVEALRARARALGLEDRVHFTGFVDENDLVDVYRSAAVFSLVSDRGVGRGEGLPLTPLEAAACGAPIIVGNQDGSREACAGEQNGFAIDPFDIEGHAMLLRRLYEDEVLRARMGDAARARVVEQHAFGVFRERLARIMGELGA